MLLSNDFLSSVMLLSGVKLKSVSCNPNVCLQPGLQGVRTSGNILKVVFLTWVAT
jgi:hypothetical protein